MSRYLLCALCALVCAPAWGSIILTEDTTLGADAVPTAYVVHGGTTTVLAGAPIRGITIDTPGASAILLGDDGSGLNSFAAINGGSVEVFGGKFLRSHVVGPGSMAVIHGGTFTDNLHIEWDADVTINGGEFLAAIGTMDWDVAYKDGTLTVNGGDFRGPLLIGKKLGWTINLHGGSGLQYGETGNIVNVYGYALERSDVNQGTWIAQGLTGFLADGSPFYGRTDSRDGLAPWVIHSLGDAVPGDTNADDSIDLLDLNNVRNNFGGNEFGDADFDGDVDIADLNVVRNGFGTALNSPAAFSASVPEPATLLLAIVVILGSMCRRHWQSTSRPCRR